MAGQPAVDGLWSTEELRRRETAARIRPESPFMLRPDGAVDAQLSLYFNSATFQRLAASSQVSYTTDYRTFFNFLHLRGKTWTQALVEDLEDFEDWRRRSPDNPARIGGSKWTRELSALHRLYAWAVRSGVVEVSPVTTTVRAGRNGGLTEQLDAAARDVRSSNVKWLTPRAAHRYTTVGLAGLTADGLPDTSYRGRNGDRNASFANLLFDSGLRLREASTLLELELPDVEGAARFHWGRVANAVAKWNSGRPFCVTTSTLRSIASYQLTTRSDYVRKAQQKGIYERLPGKLILTGVRTAQSPLLDWVDLDTGVASSQLLDRVKAHERMRLFRETDDGLEPLWLWLGEQGTPFTPHSWEGVFADGSQRCQRLLGAGAPYCTPHMARHSFALQMLLAMQHAMDARFGLDLQQRRDFELLYGNPWRMVKDLLGHRSEEVTRNIYLAPVRDIQVRTLLEGDLSAGIEFLQALALASGQVQDVTA